MDITRERHQQRMLSLVTGSYLAYKREVDYKGSMMLYSIQRGYIVLKSHTRYTTDLECKVHSMINLSLSTTLTLMINTLLPLEQK